MGGGVGGVGGGDGGWRMGVRGGEEPDPRETRKPLATHPWARTSALTLCVCFLPAVCRWRCPSWKGQAAANRTAHRDCERCGFRSALHLTEVS